MEQPLLKIKQTEKGFSLILEKSLTKKSQNQMTKHSPTLI